MATKKTYKDLTQIPNYKNVYRGAEYYSFSNNIDKHIYFPNAYDPNGELYYCGEFGVNPAVNEFCVKNNYKVKITNEYWGTWIIKKK